MTRLELVTGQIKAARKYTEILIDAMEPGDWFRQPSEGVTHLAWQVGHLAIAQYRLALQRVRGTRAGDGNLIPEEYLKLFGKGSVPVADAGKYPSPEEIRGVFDGVHRQVLRELAELPEEVLDEPTEGQHPMFHTKCGALEWSAEHEFLHAGQIGLLRRLFGSAPLR
jgi:hypothetical protein